MSTHNITLYFITYWSVTDRNSISAKSVKGNRATSTLMTTGNPSRINAYDGASLAYQLA